jgi:hypothetical protein
VNRYGLITDIFLHRIFFFRGHTFNSAGILFDHGLIFEFDEQENRERAVVSSRSRQITRQCEGSGMRKSDLPHVITEFSTGEHVNQVPTDHLHVMRQVFAIIGRKAAS